MIVLESKISLWLINSISTNQKLPKEIKCVKFSRDFEIQIGHQILVTSSNLIITNKKVDFDIK